MQFRLGINALRAIAVLAVILYHFEIPGFSGGFAGVDVFFVISGFLMTAIIYQGLATDEFSLLNFYASRAKRIVPALGVLCAGMFVFGFFFLPISDYRDLLRTAKEASLFYSNFTFAEAGNYFSAPLRENWLLHTWSLSVELQFYMLYPILLTVLHRFFSVSVLRTVVVLLGAASLVASVLLTPHHAVSAFYLLPTRAWEMLAGGMIFLYPIGASYRYRYGSALESVGWLGTIGSIVFIGSEQHWPGYLAVVPVFFASLVILAENPGAFSKNAVLQYVGKISYSVYLWHWPVVVFLYTSGLLGDKYYVLGGICLSFFLGAMSYKFVELPASKIKPTSRSLLGFFALVLVLVITCTVMSSVAKKYPQIRFFFTEPVPPQYSTQLFSQVCRPNDLDAADCTVGSGEVAAILLGDSHAQATAAAVALENKGATLYWSKGGCPILTNYEMPDKTHEGQCKKFIADKINLLKNSYPGLPLILFSHTSLYMAGGRESNYVVSIPGGTSDHQPQAERYKSEYARTVCDIAKKRPVYVVKPLPEMPFNVYKSLSLQYAIFGRRLDITEPIEHYHKLNSVAEGAIDLAEKECGVKVLDPVPVLCPDGKCMGSKNGIPLYYDDNHLVDAGNKILSVIFKTVFGGD